MVVSDSLKALELYEKIFEIERVEISDFPEVSFKERARLWEEKWDN